jgi:hypothetical protein
MDKPEWVRWFVASSVGHIISEPCDTKTEAEEICLALNATPLLHDVYRVIPVTITPDAQPTYEDEHD